MPQIKNENSPTSITNISNEHQNTEIKMYLDLIHKGITNKNHKRNIWLILVSWFINNSSLEELLKFVN